ncbi:MAG: twin-arginine translocation signal domain-containing protein, partial [Planctomycetota bacterium]
MINRRQFLKITGAGAVGVFTGSMTSLLDVPYAAAKVNTASEFIPDLDI